MVGLHADGATRVIIEYAAKHRVPFAVVPCCSDNSMPYNPWMRHLAELATGLGLCVDEETLPMTGRARVLVGTPSRYRSSSEGVRRHERCAARGTRSSPSCARRRATAAGAPRTLRRAEPDAPARVLLSGPLMTTTSTTKIGLVVALFAPFAMASSGQAPDAPAAAQLVETTPVRLLPAGTELPFKGGVVPPGARVVRKEHPELFRNGAALLLAGYVGGLVAAPFHAADGGMFGGLFLIRSHHSGGERELPSPRPGWAQRRALRRSRRRSPSSTAWLRWPAWR